MSILGAALHQWVSGQSVYAAIGARFDFASGTRRVYRGALGPITDSNGHTWDAIGDVGKIGGLQLGYGDVGEPLTFELSGLPGNFMTVAVNQRTELKGRACAVYLFVFDKNWQIVGTGAPISLRTAVMDRMVRRFDAQSRLASITLTAESFLVTRFRTPNAYLTHSDQIARYPTDYGCERMSGYTGPARMLYWGS